MRGSVLSAYSVSDGTLARLHAIFGPMLVSAMMLVDREEGEL